MSEELDRSGQVGAANRERKAVPVVERTVKGLGTVRIRRLSTGEVLDFAEDSHFNVQMVLAAVLNAGEGAGPMFASEREVKALDWGVFKALAAECSAVNSLDLEAAKKG